MVSLFSASHAIIRGGKTEGEIMKIRELKTFVVGNPPPGFGGRYFIFLKLVTDDGIEGVGEVYAATFGPHVVARMIEDVVERHVIGGDPFHIEAMWRQVYGRGYSARPDMTLMGVLSGIEMACWDIVGKAVGKPVYELLGGLVHERLRTYTYIYPKADDPGGTTSASLSRSRALGRQRAAEYVAQGFTAVKFDPAGALRAPSIRASRAWSASSSPRPSAAACARRSAPQGRPPVRHPRPVHRLRRDPPGAAPRALRAALVRGAGAAGDARGDGAGRARHVRIPIATGERLTTKYEFARVLETGRRLDPADEPRPRRRPAGGQEDRRHGRGPLRPDRPAPLLRARSSVPPTSSSPPASRTS